ncbi:MAG: YdbH domain-containing protein [Halioglobus sp.]
MTPLRISLSILALLFALILGGAIYSYTQLPAVTEQQAKKYLKDFGVKALKYEGLKLSSRHLKFDKLRLEGSFEDIDYKSAVSSLELTFDWRELSKGRLISLTADSLTLDVKDNSSESVESEAPKSLKLSSLLPQQYLKQIPLELIEVGRFELNYEKAATALNVKGSLRYDDQLAIELQLKAADISLEGRLWTEGIEQYPHTSITLAHLDTKVGSVSTALKSEADQSWEWSVMGDIEYDSLIGAIQSANQSHNLQLDLSGVSKLALVGKSQFNAKVRHGDSLVLESKELENLLPQFTIDIQTNNQLKQLSLENIVQGLSADLPVAVTLNGGLTTVTIFPTSINAELVADNSALPADLKSWLTWGNTIPVYWDSPQEIAITSQPDGSWTSQLKSNTLQVGGKNSHVRVNNLNAKIHLFANDEVRGSAEIDTRIISRLRRSQLPALKLAAKLQGTEADARFEFRLDDIAESMKAAASGQANLSSGASSVEVQLASSDLSYASETVLPLLHSLDLLSTRIDPKITSGRLTLNSLVSSESFELTGIDLASEFNINELSGEYDSYSFDGVAMRAKWQGIDQLRTIEPVDISIANLNVGIELRDIQLHLSLPKKTPVSEPAIVINQLSSRIFGGEVYLPQPKSWDFGAKSNNFIVKAKGWQLADMVALQQDEDIQAQGILEGQLPVELTEGRLIIADGYLRAVAPGGTIRYIANEASEALSASNPELELALDLLSDFQFHVLSSEVELDKGGNLLLGLSLQGKNPSQFDGRPVNFNINLEQNLDPLLQSLRLSDKLVEKLEAQLK